MVEAVQGSQFFSRLKLPIYLFLVGLSLIALGILSFRFFQDSGNDFKVEVIEPADSSGIILADLSGAVLRPGVYELEKGSRINDLLIRGGGLSAMADRDWVAKNLNLADEVADGQKYFIPIVGQSGEEVAGLIDINSASLSQLESLEGIGEKRAQDIVDHRPYSTTNDLINNDIIPESVFEKIQEKISVF